MSRHHDQSSSAVGGLRGFVHRWGWRAYAVPVLAVLTVLALVRGTSSPTSPTHARAATEVGGTRADAAALEQHAVAGFDQPAKALTPITISTTTDSNGCAGNSYKQLAHVSLHLQRVWMCEGQRQVYTSLVTTGSSVDNDQTPVGSWRVQSRERDRYLVGPGYKDYVNYWIPFNGDFGFHDAGWQTMAFGSQNYKTEGSHGCVHMPLTTVAWLYHWVKVNDTVVTITA